MATKLSGEVTAITTLPSASGVSATVSSGASDITVSWTNNDDSSDGGIDVERSKDGFATVTTVGSSLSPSATSFTDTTTVDGESYQYRVERSTDHATATSGAVSVVNDLPPVSNVSIDTSSLSGFELSWVKEDSNPDGSIEVYRSTTPGNLGTNISGQLSPTTTTFVDNTVSQNQAFYYTIRRVV